MPLGDVSPCSCGATIYLVPMCGDFWQFRHGENPEHVLRITGLEIAASQRPREGELPYLERRVREWRAAIHDWERGQWPKGDIVQRP